MGKETRVNKNRKWKKYPAEQAASMGRSSVNISGPSAKPKGR